MTFSKTTALWYILFCQRVLTAPLASTNPITLSAEAPENAPVVPSDLVSFSIELRNLARFTGSVDQPNQFSKNLLDNLKEFTGVYPLIRVGGGSQ